MQPQQQTVVTSAGPVVQPMYISHPYQTASVVKSYRRQQSNVIGVLLIIGGCLSIIFNIVDISVGIWIRYKYDSYYYFHRGGYRYTSELSSYLNGVSGHGFWCGIMVSIKLFNDSMDYVVGEIEKLGLRRLYSWTKYLHNSTFSYLLQI